MDKNEQITYEEWKENYEKLIEMLGMSDKMIVVGDCLFTSAWHEYVGIGYDLREVFKDVMAKGS